MFYTYLGLICEQYRTSKEDILLSIYQANTYIHLKEPQMPLLNKLPAVASI